MALVTRISRLFRADLHAVLDRLEEPDVLLRQAVREMEEDLARDEHRLKQLAHDHADVVAREAGLQHSITQVDEQVDVSFAAANDDLARAVIRRRLELDQLARAVGRRRQGLEASITALQTRTETNRTRLEAMRQKADVLAEEEPRRPAEEPWLTPDLSVRAEDVEVAFLREKQRRAQP